MNVLLIGSGGREHALAWKIAQSPLLKKLWIAPGNAGISEIGECVSIKADDIESLFQFAKKEKIDLTIVGPEVPLVKGITDRFQQEGLLVFGPSKEAAQLEGSKIFSKQIMKEARVPTAEFEIFYDSAKAKEFVINGEPPFVIKADGLAAGKGVVVAGTCEEAVDAINQMMTARIFGDAGAQILIEKCLIGEELSVLALTDGDRILSLASAQDHKRAHDNDHGPNTGGMGAYSPAPFVNEQQLDEIVKLTGAPIIHRLKERGIIYRGLLYIGIMMTEDGPKVLEYNVRFGDPETQAILPRLKTDLLPLFHQIAEGKLSVKDLEWDSRPCLSVVMASRGYPGSYETGFPISGLHTVKQLPDVSVFHAGTSKNLEGKTITAGGRVLNISALGVSLKEAYEKAYDALKAISFDGSFYRNDIGKRALLRTKDSYANSK